LTTAVSTSPRKRRGALLAEICAAFILVLALRTFHCELRAPTVSISVQFRLASLWRKTTSSARNLARQRHGLTAVASTAGIGASQWSPRLFSLRLRIFDAGIKFSACLASPTIIDRVSPEAAITDRLRVADCVNCALLVTHNRLPRRLISTALRPLHRRTHKSHVSEQAVVTGCRNVRWIGWRRAGNQKSETEPRHPRAGLIAHHLAYRYISCSVKTPQLHGLDWPVVARARVDANSRKEQRQLDVSQIGGLAHHILTA